jgi:hypothetical protein
MSMIFEKPDDLWPDKELVASHCCASVHSQPAPFLSQVTILNYCPETEVLLLSHSHATHRSIEVYFPVIY